MIALQTATVLVAVLLSTVNGAATPTASYLPQSSPAYLPTFPKQAGVITAWPPVGNTTLPSGPLSTAAFTFTGYPTMNVPVANAATDPNIIPLMKLIDWTHVPAAPPTSAANFAATYPASDPYCWWTHGGCVTPKINYIPPDISICPVPNTWGLTYDDGPMYYYPVTPENSKWAEPNLYDFLLANGDQKANLFYIGSRIMGAPAAAQRGLNDGHTICVHTWSHPLMTTLTNEEVVAEFYYSMRMMKETLGITPKCWRPPFGDVDDRIRAIAWQMGMRTIIWDQDTDDWEIIGDLVNATSTSITYETANNTVNGWIQNHIKGNDTQHGHITLEHELSNSTITLAEFWLPTIQKLYKTMPATACNNIAQPYWEESFVYPIQGDQAVSTNGSAVGKPGSTPSGAGGNTGPAGSNTPSIKNAASSLQAMGSVMTLVVAAIMASVL